MCDYTQVEYACSHLRYTVRSWCTKYQETHKRCPPNVVAIEYRLNEKCGDCKSSKKYEYKKPAKDSEKKDDEPESSNASASTSATASSSSSEKST